MVSKEDPPKKKRARKESVQVTFKPTSMRRDDMPEEEEDPAANPPPAKQKKLMEDALKSAAPSKSKPKAPTSKARGKTIRNISAAEKNKAPVPEMEEEEEDDEKVLRKLKPKIPDHDDTHPILENMNLRKDACLCLWRKNDPYSIRRRTVVDYMFHTMEQ